MRSFIHDLAFMDSGNAPIFYPAIIKLGYDPMWFAIVICITVMAGAVVLPVAINVFVVKNITKTPFGVIYVGVIPFFWRSSSLLCSCLRFPIHW